MPETTQEGLIRAIGTRALGLSVINMIVGAGIFALPGLVAAILGPAAIIAYLLCSVVVALVFLCFAEAGSRVSRSGGAYAYIEDAFGPYAGFLASILLWFGWGALANAAVVIALVEMLGYAFPFFDDAAPRAAFIIIVFAVMAYVNVVGVRSGVRFASFNTYVKLVPLFALVVLGAFSMQWENIVITSWPPMASIGAGTLLLVFAFGGAELALNASGEIKEPSRTVPMGLLLGIGVVFVLYTSIQGVAQGVLGPDLALNSDAPLVATAERALGPFGRTFLLIGAGLSMFGVTSGHLLNNPRAVFAAARDGLLPRQLAAVHPRFRTPHLAIIFYAVVACGFALSGAFKTLAVVSSGSVLLIYFGCSLAVLKLRRMDTGVATDTASDVAAPARRLFRIPGGPTVPLLSAAAVVWLLSNMTQGEATGLGALLLASTIAFLAQRAYKRNTQRKSIDDAPAEPT
jgi:amino acid transporter